MNRKAYLVRDNSNPSKYCWKLVCPSCWHHSYKDKCNYRKIEITDEPDTYCEHCDGEIL